MEYQRLSPEQAAAQFWDGMRCVANVATTTGNTNLFQAIQVVGQAAMAVGIPMPETGEFVRCPTCDAMPGQRCINMPGHRLSDHVHPERTERARQLRVDFGQAQSQDH
ncbi:hypothetical protein [Micromonospora sp. NPDC004551]|uniref:zinc finger domain-containing protein n=1 Tax=Micromonospora sp. NPDC004551 TaxID=3154284 RepID=UPI0033B31BAA